MAQQIRHAYKNLFGANEYAYKLGKNELVPKLRTLTGAAADDSIIPSVAGTFQHLCQLANFEGGPSVKHTTTEQAQKTETTAAERRTGFAGELGISYTINLNLPATTEIEVFNAIFKALKEHILHEE